MKSYMKTILNGYKIWVSNIVKKSTADWGQSDKEATNYVKNRTHYDDVIKTDISGTIRIVDITGSVSQIKESIPLELGQIWSAYRMYNDSWNEYCTFEVKQSEDGSFYIGDPLLMDETNSPVIYLTMNELVIPEGMNAQGYTAFKFICVSGSITQEYMKQLDPKYIPTATNDEMLDLLVKTIDLSPLSEDGKYLLEGEKFLII